MKIIRSFLLVALGMCITLLIFTFSTPYPNPVTHMSHQSTIDSAPARLIGECYEQTLNSSVDVYVSSDIGPEKGGDFTGVAGKMPQIRLVDTDLKTVAHEVSHLVDYLLAQRGISDGETEAYLQGYYTNCVYDLI